LILVNTLIFGECLEINMNANVAGQDAERVIEWERRNFGREKPDGRGAIA